MTKQGDLTGNKTNKNTGVAVNKSVVAWNVGNSMKRRKKQGRYDTAKKVLQSKDDKKIEENALKFQKLKK